MCWLCICFAVGWESQEVKGPIHMLWVNFRTPRNRVIHGKRVVWRHLAEHGITSSSDSDGVLSLHTPGVHMMIFLKGLFILRFSWPYPGLDYTREWGGNESFTGTDGDLFCWWPCPVGDFCLVLVGDHWFWSLGSKLMTMFYGSQSRIHADVMILCLEIHSQPAIVSSFCIIACLFSKK